MNIILDELVPTFRGMPLKNGRLCKILQTLLGNSANAVYPSAICVRGVSGSNCQANVHLPCPQTTCAVETSLGDTTGKFDNRCLFNPWAAR